MRPTLKAQLDWQDKQTAKIFSPPNKLEFWLFSHCDFLLRLLTWNWFCIWCGKRHFPPSEKRCSDKYYQEKKDGS